MDDKERINQRKLARVVQFLEAEVVAEGWLPLADTHEELKSLELGILQSSVLYLRNGVQVLLAGLWAAL